MFARGSRGLHHFQMQKIRRGDDDDLHLRVIDHPPPVGGGLGETQLLLGFRRPMRHVVGADHQPRPHACIVETVVHHPIGTAMHRSHPAHSDYTNAD